MLSNPIAVELETSVSYPDSDLNRFLDPGKKLILFQLCRFWSSDWDQDPDSDSPESLHPDPDEMYINPQHCLERCVFIYVYFQL
jgi:hypothetical protein